MIIVIKTAEETVGDYGTYVKVIGVDGKGKETFKNVSDKFKDKWPLLKANATVEFKMTQKDNKWIIADIIPGGELLPSPQTATPLPSTTPLKEIPGQQIGMTTKEIGDMIRSEKLIGIFGPEIAIELIKWYRGQVLGTTRITFDGDKLPKLKAKETTE